MLLEDLLAINSVNLRNALNDLGNKLVLVVLAERVPNWISNEQDTLNFGEHCYLVELVPRSNTVVSKEESTELHAVLKTINLIDLVIAEPQLFKRLADFIECHNSLDVVAA